MPTLLSLPLELRSQILKDVLTSSIPAPSSPRTCTYGPRIPILDEDFICGGYEPPNILFPSKSPIVNATPLLLTNRQLHTETKDILSRNSTKNVKRYLLDVMFVDEEQLWPTWLCIPYRTTRVDTVRANFRVFGTLWKPEVRPGVHGSGPWSSPLREVPPSILRTFYVLLESFLCCGPSVAREYADTDRGITIGTLELDFLSPEDPSRVLALVDAENQEAWWQSRDTYRRRVRANSTEGEMRPEWLLDLVKRYIAGLLGVSYYDAEHGLYERVGVIKFLLNGELDKQWDLGETLRGLRGLEKLEPNSTFGNLDRDERVDYFGNWKDRTLAKRKEAGFPVLS